MVHCYNFLPTRSGRVFKLFCVIFYLKTDVIVSGESSFFFLEVVTCGPCGLVCSLYMPFLHNKAFFNIMQK